MKILHLDGKKDKIILAQIERILRKGGTAVVPTDTVYGLVCDGLDEAAKDRIFEIKGRSGSKPLIGFVDNLEKVKRWAEAPPGKIAVVEKEWPGAVTFIFKAKSNLPRIVSKAGKIAFRMPDHKFLLDLIGRFEILASTSANISGEKAPSCLEDIPDILKEAVDVVIDGGLLPGKPSEIRDITGKEPVRLR